MLRGYDEIKRPFIRQACKSIRQVGLHSEFQAESDMKVFARGCADITKMQDLPVYFGRLRHEGRRILREVEGGIVQIHVICKTYPVQAQVKSLSDHHLRGRIRIRREGRVHMIIISNSHVITSENDCKRRLSVLSIT